MIIALPPQHPAAHDLERLCSELREIQRGQGAEGREYLTQSLNISETCYGKNVASYTLQPGRASNDEAIAAYRCLRTRYPSILELLCVAAGNRAGEVTIEVGSLKRSADTQYSQHDMIDIMPRILSGFRGHAPSS